MGYLELATVCAWNIYTYKIKYTRANIHSYIGYRVETSSTSRRIVFLHLSDERISLICARDAATKECNFPN